MLSENAFNCKEGFSNGNEENIPAQEASEKNGARLPQENEDCKRQKSTQETQSKRKSKTLLLIGSIKPPIGGFSFSGAI